MENARQERADRGRKPQEPEESRPPAPAPKHDEDASEGRDSAPANVERDRKGPWLGGG